jgi:hypothetical protein
MMYLNNDRIIEILTRKIEHIKVLWALKCNRIIPSADLRCKLFSEVLGMADKTLPQPNHQPKTQRQNLVRKKPRGRGSLFLGARKKLYPTTNASR